MEIYEMFKLNLRGWLKGWTSPLKDLMVSRFLALVESVFTKKTD